MYATLKKSNRFACHLIKLKAPGVFIQCIQWFKDQGPRNNTSYSKKYTYNNPTIVYINDEMF